MKSNKKIVAGCLSAALLVQSISFTAAAAPVGKEQMWKSIAFGQSTDVNFSSTILPEKVGTNYTYPYGSDEPLPTEVEESVQDVTIESRGGKIKSSHDGITFYYTEVPTDKNFKLTADVTIEQLGPENESAPNAQEGCGLMVRDINSPARKDPLVVGYEEYPAASNMVMLELVAASKSKDADINLKAMARYGVNDPAGNSGVVTPNNTFAKSVARALKNSGGSASPSNASKASPSEAKDAASPSRARKATESLAIAYDEFEEEFFEDRERSVTNCYHTTMKLGLERTDEGFACYYYNEDGSINKSYVFTDKEVTPNIIAHLDKEYYRVGFFASRNARMTVKNIQLDLSDVEKADTTPAYVAPNKEGVSFNIASPDYTNSDSYAVQALMNFDGTMTIQQDGAVIAEELPVTGGEQFVYHSKINGIKSVFSLTYTPSEGSNTGKAQNKEITVVKEEYGKDLYVAPNADDTGAGTVEDPISVTAAIKRLAPGGTIYLASGTYAPINIPLSASGNEDQPKSMIAQGHVIVTAKDTNKKLFVLDSDYWRIKGLDIDGKDISGSRGFMLHGSHNIVENCKIHNTSSDAGLTITKSRGQRALWPSYNLVQNCEAYENIDASRINADGFASKSGSGDENRFYNCVSHDNADDGWDLFNTLDDGPNGTTVIENCIAYNNGNNGFKLGGEGREVAHTLRNSIAFDNGLDGITDNFNPGELLIENNTSFDNARFNFILRPSPYKTDENGNFTADGTVKSNVSYRSEDYMAGKGRAVVFSDEDQEDNTIYDDSIAAKEVDNNFFFLDGENSVEATDFASLDRKECYTWGEDGSLIFGDFLLPSPDGIIAENGAGANADKIEPTPEPDPNPEPEPSPDPEPSPEPEPAPIKRGSGDSSSSTYTPAKKGKWIQDSNGWWYCNADHTWPSYKWMQIDGEWYYFNEQGYMVTGWHTDPVDNRLYYLNPVSDGTKGKMIVGWKEIDGNWYYFNMVSDGHRGSLLKNQMTPDGYYVNENGIWIR